MYSRLACAAKFYLASFQQKRSKRALNLNKFMFRAIGFLIILWGVSLYFGSSIRALDQAATATFETVEVAAVVYRSQMENQK